MRAGMSRQGGGDERGGGGGDGGKAAVKHMITRHSAH
jgi:hypothetical protein